MNNEAKKRVQDLFEGMEENTLSALIRNGWTLWQIFLRMKP